VWVFIWGLLWAIYFITDGFDLGAGVLLPFVARNETERRTIYNATGPLSDGNEVWLITAGGVTFAAFPRTYAVMFSTLHEALTLKIMLGVVVLFVPLVLAYQLWAYRLFSGEVDTSDLVY
jgi:cytochrome d ubiquinol oxidase subunit II